MGVVSISIDEEIRIEAVSARLHATFSGSNRLLGGAAARQAAEVRALVGELAGIGLGEDAVEIEGVRVQTGQGTFKLGQSALIEVAVSAPNDKVAAALGVLAGITGVTVERIEWVYDGFEASVEAVKVAMRKARQKADAIATVAGLVVTGIKQASDSWHMPIREVQFGAGAAPLMARGAKADAMDFGVEVNSSTTLNVHLGVDFEVSPAD